MRTNRRQTRIIGWLALLMLALMLQACSAVRLGYNNAPQLAFWWLDGYFDFDRSQSPKLRSDLSALLEWHRREELPRLEQQLVQLQALSQQDITPAQVCSVYADLQARVVRAMEEAANTLAATAVQLDPAQLQQLDQVFQARDVEWRAEWLEGSPEERAERRMHRAQEWAEWFYGALTGPQEDLLRERFAKSQFDPAFQHREKLRRHQDMLATLRSLNHQPLAQAKAGLRALLGRTVVSADPAYRQHLELLVQENCVTVAALHNSSNPRQRARLRKTLQAYANDVTALHQTKEH